MSPSFLQQKVFQIIQNHQKHSFLLAVSGGVDSMVLAHLFHSQGAHFQIAHINYKLRNEDSERDQKLVERFCEKNNIKLHIYQVSAKDQKPEGSIQLWARDLRYAFFEKIIKNENLDFLVTAHHLNDHLETFLINLSRGSGIKGLSGIPDNANGILRPLLSFTKKEIYQYAEEHRIEFGEDVSNKKNDYLRNQIRNQIVPLLENTHSEFLKNFNKSISIINETREFVEEQILKIESKLLHSKNSEIWINKELFSKESSFVQFEILRKYGFENRREIEKMFNAQTGSLFHSSTFDLLINRGDFILKSNKTDSNVDIETEIVIPQNGQKTINLYDYLDLSDFEDCEKINWKFDVDEIRFPLKLRHHKKGDLFFPLGMKGKQKISKFFKDKKISIFAKQKIWILVDSEDQILGILPYRQDGRFATRNDEVKNFSIIYNTKK